MKIAMIGHKRFNPLEGGIEKVVYEQSIRMAARGHKVICYDRGGKGLYDTDYEAKGLKEYKGVRIVTIPTVKGAAEVPLYSFLAVFRAVIDGCDVICFHGSGSCNMIPIGRLFRKRCIGLIHGIDSRRDKWHGFAVKYLEHGEKTAAKMANACLVLSEHDRQYFKEKYGADTIRFANGVAKPERKSPDIIQQKHGLTEGSYILALSRITPEKGLHYLIEAYRDVASEKKLVIAGGMDSPDYEKQLRDLADGDPRVMFAGFVKGQEKAELYSNAYLYCMPSNLEGMANTLLEAMAYGNCCLLSDIAENKEPAGDHALYFHKGDAAGLRSQLADLVKSPETVERYRRTAADYVCERYNWDLITDQMLDIFSGKRSADYAEYMPRNGIAL
ncbi:MAG: glycosyltransferase family 4 protein [Clostridia bacterium]|nr:glycosyltransferase family 4 protein [Clostridia bacterium]